jgi:putative acetyltransferase
MKTFVISAAAPPDYQEIVDVWESSVRPTHRFLTEDDIAYFKPLILRDYLKAVDLHIARNEANTIVGFVGVAGDKLEMLFLHPDYFGHGLGKKLLRFAIDTLKAQFVDVNEQNEQAVGFYLHNGFEVISRSPLDSLGKPFPILHMALSQGA